MAKNLVIVESPGKIKTIGKVLGRGFTVKASVGHVRDLPGTRKDDKLKDALVVGVAKDFSPYYMPLPRKAKVVEGLRAACQKAEKVYLCPDPDREGEAIAWHLAELLELTPERIVRVTFDEITPRGIRAGLAHPRSINMDLVNSQQARRVLDRIVGYTLSPLLTKSVGGGHLTAGRVQSVAVRLLVEREKEIKAFKAEAYWTVEGIFRFAGRSFEASLRALDGRQVVAGAEDLAKFKASREQMSVSGVVRTLIANAAEASEIVAALRNAAYAVRFHEVKEVEDAPYPPFATSQLQQAAAVRLRYDTRRTMRIAQDLYEGVPLGPEGPVALITYMRTDSFRISRDALDECRKYVAGRYGPQYLPENPRVYRSRAGAQEAHECIRPTDVSIRPEAVKQYLSDDQYRLYKLIHDRFVACQMQPAVFEATAADIEARGQATRNAIFRANGRVLKFDGWLAVEGGATATQAAHVEATAADREKGDETENGEEPATPDKSEPRASASVASEPRAPASGAKKSSTQVLPAMKVGDQPALETIEPVEHFTQPPPRYTEASLVKKLEREGIGRPSTYAAILSRVQDVGYAQKLGTGGRAPLAATPLGILVTERLEGHFPSILELGFTRDMEAELDKIEEAHLDWRQAVADFYGPFAKDLEKARKAITRAKPQGEKTDVPCPKCGSPMNKWLSKFGYYLKCSKAPECKATLRLDVQGRVQQPAVPQTTGLKCDLCGSDVVKSTGRFGPYLHCVNYRKKDQKDACSFTMRVNKEGHPLRKFAPLATDRVCEKCGSKLVVRVAARRRNKRPFLSCPNFPKCRFAADLPPELAALGEQALQQWQAMDAKNKADLAVYQAHQAAKPAEVQAPPA
jgi:DNA topoisomerase-1